MICVIHANDALRLLELKVAAVNKVMDESTIPLPY